MMLYRRRRRRVSFLDYVSSSLPRRRPANAPPTYDDAVKNDNEVRALRFFPRPDQTDMSHVAGDI